jgi:hypothetical protein
MTLVALDVAAILADIFVALIACDMHLEKERWVGRVREGLHVTAAVFSGLFLGELGVSVWAEGLRYVVLWCCVGIGGGAEERQRVRMKANRQQMV